MPGDCHYLEGNVNAKRRVERVKYLLEQVGLEPERVRFYNLSSAMGSQFADKAKDMALHIQELGPNRLKHLP
jgi:F420-non-reducing hydrogenase iron-sulfur subunit